jgi:TPR repeat protein
MLRGLVLSCFFGCSAFLAPSFAARSDALDRVLPGAAERFCQSKCEGGCIDLTAEENLLDGRWNPWHSATDAELQHAIAEGDQQAVLWAALQVGGTSDESAKRQAFSEVKALHHAGLAEATMVLGSLYWSGVGVTRDQRRARELFLSALDRGMKWAASPLALIDMSKADGPPNHDDVMRYLGIAVEAGSLPAMHNLALLLVRGPEELRDVRRALTLLRRASEAGSVQAAAALALVLYETGDVSTLDEAMHSGERAYCRGSDSVGPTLGRVYRARNLEEDELAIALAWAEKGHAMGFRMVFRSMYAKGEKANAEIAVAAARRAYELSQDDADLHNKGLALVRLGATEADVAEGLETLKLSAGRGYAISANTLADVYRGFRGIAPNREEFERWRARAIELGDRDAAGLAFERPPESGGDEATQQPHPRPR